MSLWQDAEMEKRRINSGTGTTSWPLTETERKLMVAATRSPGKTVLQAEKTLVADGSGLWQSHKPAPHAWRE